MNSFEYMKRRIVLAIVTLLIASCKREDPEPIITEPETDCANFDIADGECIFFVEYTNVGPVYQMPCFNPNNGEEFIYREGKAIWRYSISTKESSLLTDNIRMFCQPSWSLGNHIAFTESDWQVWLMRSDGSDLKQISSGDWNWHPEFNTDGDQLLYSAGNELKVVNLSGAIEHSFCKQYKDTCAGWRTSSWSLNDLLAAEYMPNENEYGLCLYSLNGDVLDVLYRSDGTNENDDFITSIQWHPDNQRVFFTDGFGIKSVDIETKQLKIIRSSCDRRTYADISISPDGDRLVAARTDATYADCVVTQQTGIVIMDIDGSNETELLMP